jgi:hypothetical protein
VASKTRPEATAPRLPESAFERNVLLLDATEERLFARAAAMRALGATVQCASTADAARSTWKPGSHQLVMIDLNGAGTDFNDFYQYARTTSTKQAFAFYIAEPPYLSSTPDGAGVRPARRRNADAAQPGNGALALDGDHSVAEAARRIASVRLLVQPPAETAEPSAAATRSLSFSAAVKAAERLAGGKP